MCQVEAEYQACNAAGGVLGFAPGVGGAVLIRCFTPKPPANVDLCEAGEVAYLTAYLGKHQSPLTTIAPEIVFGSDLDSVDDRFIVALAGAESSYGTNLNPKWGPYDAWNVQGGGYAGFLEAL